MILHDIPDNPELVEVATSTMRTKRFLESDLHGSDIVPVPRWIKYAISESQTHQILYHFFAQIMIDTINLFFAEQ